MKRWRVAFLFGSPSVVECPSPGMALEFCKLYYDMCDIISCNETTDKPDFKFEDVFPLLDHPATMVAYNHRDMESGTSSIWIVRGGNGPETTLFGNLSDALEFATRKYGSEMKRISDTHYVSLGFATAVMQQHVY